MEIEPTRSRLGQALSARRLELGLTQSELGELAGLDQTVVSRIESGIRGLDALELIRIARALNADLHDLLELSPTEQPAELLAFRLSQENPNVAKALSWVTPFADNLDWLESNVRDG